MYSSPQKEVSIEMEQTVPFRSAPFRYTIQHLKNERSILPVKLCTKPHSLICSMGEHMCSSVVNVPLHTNLKNTAVRMNRCTLFPSNGTERTTHDRFKSVGTEQPFCFNNIADGNRNFFLRATVGVYTKHGYTLPHKQCVSI